MMRPVTTTQAQRALASADSERPDGKGIYVLKIGA
jgi:hypothetical protein